MPQRRTAAEKIPPPPRPQASNPTFVLLIRNKLVSPLARRLSLFFLFALLSAGCASSKNPLSYYHPEFTRQDPVSLLAKAEEVEKQDFENVKLETLAQNELSSHHLVVIKRAEPLHYHAAHDGWAVVLKGEGQFILGDRTFEIHPGSSVYIPRGIRHRAIRRGKDAIAAFVIFTPPYDGKDTVPVEGK